MMKTKLILILISNMFMLHLIPLFKVLRLNELIRILVKQASTNIKFVESQIGGNNNE